MDYFMFNLYFLATWVLIAAGIIAILIKLPTKTDTKNETSALPLFDVMPSLFKEYRQRLNMSMQDVADKSGISKATISRLERGKDVRLDTFIALQKFYAANEA